MTRKLPHVGLNLSDMDERSMPEQDGLHWQTQAERSAALFDSIRRAADIATDAMMALREPIRVVAEVGEPIPEVET